MSDTELTCLKTWPFKDQYIFGYVSFAQSIWQWPEACWSKLDENSIFVSASTGGYSENEDIISAMQENFLFWNSIFWAARRGGQYVFLLDQKEKHSLRALEQIQNILTHWSHTV